MKPVIKNILVSLFCYVSSASAIRDPFTVGEENGPPQFKFTIEELTLAGTIIQTKREVAFVEDPLGNLYALHQGQWIEGTRVKVIKILQNEIILSADNHYSVVLTNEKN